MPAGCRVSDVTQRPGAGSGSAWRLKGLMARDYDVESRPPPENPYFFKRSTKELRLRASRRAASDWFPETAVRVRAMMPRSKASTCSRKPRLASKVDSAGWSAELDGAPAVN